MVYKLQQLLAFLAVRRKAVWALLSLVATDLTVVNTLHPDARLTTALAVLGLLGVGVVHQASNAPLK